MTELAGSRAFTSANLFATRSARWLARIRWKQVTYYRLSSRLLNFNWHFFARNIFNAISCFFSLISRCLLHDECVLRVELIAVRDPMQSMDVTVVYLRWFRSFRRMGTGFACDQDSLPFGISLDKD
jgi:hypothetical protein